MRMRHVRVLHELSDALRVRGARCPQPVPTLRPMSPRWRYCGTGAENRGATRQGEGWQVKLPNFRCR